MPRRFESCLGLRTPHLKRSRSSWAEAGTSHGDGHPGNKREESQNLIRSHKVAHVRGFGLSLSFDISVDTIRRHPQTMSPIPVTHALFFQLGVGTSGPQSSVFKPDGVCRTRASQQPARETCDVSQVHAPCAMPCDSEQVPIIIVKSAIPVR